MDATLLQGPISVGPAESPLDWAEATALLLDHVEWVRVAAGIDLLDAQPDFGAELGRLPHHFGGDRGRLFLARIGGIAAGTASVRFHLDGSAELKRMYVRPVARGRGLADPLVDAVVSAAARTGCEILWLETKRGAMDRAISVYRRCGFEEAGAERLVLRDPGVIVMHRPVCPPPHGGSMVTPAALPAGAI